ncbi:MAG: hypothetical protein ACOC1Z_04515 [Cyanobacteriota bacterium]
MILVGSAIAQQKIPHGSHFSSNQVTVSLGIASVIPTAEATWEESVSKADFA